MHIPNDDLQDIQELTEDMLLYVIEKLQGHDEKISRNALLGLFTSVLVNKFDPYGSYKFIERLVDIMDDLSPEEKVENEKDL